MQLFQLQKLEGKPIVSLRNGYGKIHATIIQPPAQKLTAEIFRISWPICCMRGTISLKKGGSKRHIPGSG